MKGHIQKVSYHKIPELMEEFQLFQILSEYRISINELREAYNKDVRSIINQIRCSKKRERRAE